MTHDIGETERFARVLVVADGQIVEDGAPDVLRARPGSRYAALLEAETARARVVVVRGGVAAAASRARPTGRGWGVTAAASIESCLWPLDRRDELTAIVAGAAGVGVLGPAERFEWSYADVAPALSARACAAAPAVMRVGAGAGALLGIIAHDDGGVRVVGRDGDPAVCDAAALAAYLRAPAEAEARAGIEATVARAGVEAARRPAVADALLRASLGAERVAEGERLRPRASFDVGGAAGRGNAGAHGGRARGLPRAARAGGRLVGDGGRACGGGG